MNADPAARDAVLRLCQSLADGPAERSQLRRRYLIALDRIEQAEQVERDLRAKLAQALAERDEARRQYARLARTKL